MLCLSEAVVGNAGMLRHVPAGRSLQQGHLRAVRLCVHVPGNHRRHAGEQPGALQPFQNLPQSQLPGLRKLMV